MFPITRNKAFISAYRKGIDAAHCGLSKMKNPYPDKRNVKGRPTWSRTFQRFWENGYNDGKPEGFRILEKL